MTAVKIHLDRIRLDGGTQTRVGLSDDTVGDYAEAMAAGVVFPPVVVFFDGTDYWLADGFHRVAAARLTKAKKVAAGVCQGTQRDARLYSVGANRDHGQRRTNADKRRAVEMLLRDEEWSQWSDRELAKRAGVSGEFVRQVRAASCQPLAPETPATRRGADGKSYPASRPAAQEGGASPAELAAALTASLPPFSPSVVTPAAWPGCCRFHRDGGTPGAECDDYDGNDEALPEPPPPASMPRWAEPDPDNYDGDEWYTPARYVEAAREVMGSIDLDPASCDHAQATVKAATYYTKERDGLLEQWQGNVWLNPPYSYPLVDRFTSKLLGEVGTGRVDQAVLLVNASTDPGWFQSLLKLAPACCFTAGRLRFERPDREGPANRVGQAFFYFGEDVDRFVEIFSAFGTVVARLAPPPAEPLGLDDTCARVLQAIKPFRTEGRTHLDVVKSTGLPQDEVLTALFVLVDRGDARKVSARKWAPAAKRKGGR